MKLNVNFKTGAAAIKVILPNGFILITHENNIFCRKLLSFIVIARSRIFQEQDMPLEKSVSLTLEIFFITF